MESRDEISLRIKKLCPSRIDVIDAILDSIYGGEKRILLVGATGSGKTRLAESIMKGMSYEYNVVNSSIVYGVQERLSIALLRKQFESPSVIIEELSAFCMKATARDRRIPFVLSSLLDNSGFVIATTTSQGEVDPSVLKHFQRMFVLKPLSLDGRRHLFESIGKNNMYPIVQQYHSLDEDVKNEFLMKFSGLQPSELLLSEPLDNVSSFESLAGIQDILAKLNMLVLTPLINPNRFKEIGVRPPRGILLTGPSGCGKTSIARSLGKASRVSFFDISSVDIIAKEVGESEKRLHNAFERARASSPSIILFDDIDSLAPKRTFGTTSSEASDRLLTTLLIETDGLAGKDDGVIVIATTSRLDSLDPAITRPGRFDYIIDIPLPNEVSRGEIFDLYSNGVPFQDKEQAKMTILKKSSKMTGADILGVIREAAMIALRSNIDSLAIENRHIEEALTHFSNEKQRPKVSLNPTKKRRYL